MSVFRTRTVPCPKCRQDVSLDVVYSVNADRRPDLRDAILDGSFQTTACAACGTGFRLSPEFTYINLNRKLWLAAYGAYDLGRWAEAEQEAQSTFDEAFGSRASEAARGLGDGLDKRVTFGWPAVTEKLLLREKELDDVTVELMKAAVLRSGGGGIPMNGDAELRVIAVTEAALVCAWLRTSSEEVTEVIEVPRTVYDGITAEPDTWDELRSELTEGMFVDMNRLLIQGEPGGASAP